ncbi:HupE/UreJ family protein [Roseiterribacter gracilis]|uniref:Protein hupE n=1 Tax=Roseiterribacter gracilis TaxID=2812848 RepID=A0A8S8XL68_9PROT|nr:protein hupE [Rhodospirillales bacterium TMPK1]
MRYKVTFAALLFAAPAAAHSGANLPGGFHYGLIHPLTGFDHVLAMVSVGLWGAFLGRPLIYALPILFPLLMVCGAALGMLGVALPPAELGVALSVLVLGGAIALGWRAPVWLAMMIVAVFAIFHGYTHGIELPSATDPIGYSAGFVLATGLLHVAGISIGLLNNSRHGALLTRSLGALFSFAGCWFLYVAVTS